MNLPASIVEHFKEWRRAAAGVGVALAAGEGADAGDPAGGAMVLTLIRRVRDAGLPPPAAGVAISPWANLARDGASMRDPARRDPLVEVGFLEKLAVAFAPDMPRDHPDISPVHADLDGLPPVLVLAGERKSC